MHIASIGIDLGKTTFHLVALKLLFTPAFADPFEPPPLPQEWPKLFLT